MGLYLKLGKNGNTFSYTSHKIIDLDFFILLALCVFNSLYLIIFQIITQKNTHINIHIISIINSINSICIILLQLFLYNFNLFSYLLIVNKLHLYHLTLLLL